MNDGLQLPHSRLVSYEKTQLLSLLVEQAPCPRYGAENVSVVPLASAVCSVRKVNLPLTGLLRVIVTGYGVAVP